MTSLRKLKFIILVRLAANLRRRTEHDKETDLWGRMPAVGREFGSPDFDRLMAEDHRNQSGVFDPAWREHLP